jgi:hypothetical protein
MFIIATEVGDSTIVLDYHTNCVELLASSRTVRSPSTATDLAISICVKHHF